MQRKMELMEQMAKAKANAKVTHYYYVWCFVKSRTTIQKGFFICGKMKKHDPFELVDGIPESEILKDCNGNNIRLADGTYMTRGDVLEFCEEYKNFKFEERVLSYQTDYIFASYDVKEFLEITFPNPCTVSPLVDNVVETAVSNAIKYGRYFATFDILEGVSEYALEIWADKLGCSLRENEKGGYDLVFSEKLKEKAKQGLFERKQVVKSFLDNMMETEATKGHFYVGIGRRKYRFIEMGVYDKRFENVVLEDNTPITMTDVMNYVSDNPNLQMFEGSVDLTSSPKHIELVKQARFNRFDDKVEFAIKNGRDIVFHICNNHYIHERDFFLKWLETRNYDYVEEKREKYVSLYKIVL